MTVKKLLQQPVKDIDFTLPISVVHTTPQNPNRTNFCGDRLKNARDILVENLHT